MLSHQPAQSNLCWSSTGSWSIGYWLYVQIKETRTSLRSHQWSGVSQPKTAFQTHLLCLWWGFVWLELLQILYTLSKQLQDNACNCAVVFFLIIHCFWLLRSCCFLAHNYPEVLESGRRGMITDALLGLSLFTACSTVMSFCVNFPSVEETCFSGEGGDIHWSVGLMTSHWDSDYHCGHLAEWY